MYQIDYVRAADDHRREELTRSWAGHHTSAHTPHRTRGLLTALFGGRQAR